MLYALFLKSVTFPSATASGVHGVWSVHGVIDMHPSVYLHCPAHEGRLRMWRHVETKNIDGISTLLRIKHIDKICEIGQL